MNPVTAAAFFDELTKIAEEGSGIGELFFPKEEALSSEGEKKNVSVPGNNDVPTDELEKENPTIPTEWNVQ